MAGNDELKVIVTAAVKDAMRDLKRIDAAVASSEKKWKSTAATLNKIGSGMSKYVTLPILAAGTAAVKFAADMEKQQVAFDVLLGSAERGAAIFEELKQFAAKTPLELGDITSGAQTLLAFGVASEDVTNTLQMLGDVSMGDAQKLDTLSNAYGKLRAKGKASLEEINRFTENGVPILDELAKQYGVTTEKMLDMISKGKVRFPDVEKAIKSLTSEGGKFHGMLEKMSQTTAGKLSTALDNLKLSAAKLGESLLPIANQVIDKIGAAAEKFGAMDEGGKKAVITLAAIAALAGPLMKTASSVMTLGANLAKVDWVGLGAMLAKLGPVGIAIGAGAGIIGLAAAIDKNYTRKLNEDEGFRKQEIAGTLYLAEKSLVVYQRIAESYGESLETIMAIGRSEGYVTKELEEQYRILTEQEQRRKEHQEEAARQQGDRAAYEPPVAEGAGGESPKKAWQIWFQEITGSFGETGVDAANAFLLALEDRVVEAKSFATIMGEEFDIVSVIESQQASIRSAMEQLFAIDPKDIDMPFEAWDQSIKLLAERYRDLEERRQIAIAEAPEEAAAIEEVVTQEVALIASKSRLQELIDEENSKIAESEDLWAAYYEARAKLAEEGIGTEQVMVLTAVIARLKEQLGITEQIKEEVKETYDAWEDIRGGAISTLQGEASNLLTSVADALASAKDAGEAFKGVGEAVVESAASILSSIAPLMLQAGLKLIATAGPAGMAAGLTLVAGSGLVAIAGAVIGSSISSYSSQYDYQSLILDQEEALKDQRLEILKEQLAREKELLQEALKELEQTYSTEYEVLKDLWERNLISTEEYIRRTGEANRQYAQEKETAEAPAAATEAAIAAAEEDDAALEAARTAKLSELAKEALALQEELNAMSGWNKFWSGRDEEIAKLLSTIDRRIGVVESAGTIDAITSAARGADFVTSGKQLLMVGDNPSGREHVMVRPVGAGSGQSGAVVIQIMGNVYGVDDFVELADKAAAKLSRRGVLSSS